MICWGGSSGEAAAAAAQWSETGSLMTRVLADLLALLSEHICDIPRYEIHTPPREVCSHSEDIQAHNTDS